MCVPYRTHVVDRSERCVEGGGNCSVCLCVSRWRECIVVLQKKKKKICFRRKVFCSRRWCFGVVSSYVDLGGRQYGVVYRECRGGVDTGTVVREIFFIFLEKLFFGRTDDRM